MLSELPVIAVLYCHVFSFSARDIKIVKDLQNASVTERESVTFICEVNWEDVDGKWYKDDSRLRAGDNVKIRCEGMCESLSNIDWWLIMFIKGSFSKYGDNTAANFLIMKRDFKLYMKSINTKIFIKV